MDKTLQRLFAVLDLIRWNRQYGTLLLLTPALWSLVIASNGSPPIGLVAIFCLGAFLMRSAGCVINDIADRQFDGRVERTRNRPLPTGRLTVVEALVVFAALSFLAFLLLWWLNPLTRLLSLAAIALAVLYPFTKRFFGIPQLFMGVAFGWGSIMAWTAVRNRIDLPAVLIFLATLCWATAYDTIYAMIDREDDARIGVRSSALLFGRWTWIATGLLFGLALLFLILMGLSTEMGPIYYLTLPAVTAWFLYQVLLLRQDLDHPSLFTLFKSHVGVGWLLLAGIALQFHLT